MVDTKLQAPDPEMLMTVPLLTVTTEMVLAAAAALILIRRPGQ